MTSRTVSPHLCCPLFHGGSQGSGTVAPDTVEEEPLVDTKHAVMNEPIVGQGLILSDEHGDGALAATPLKSPKPMTPAEKAVHDLTHLPYHPACPHCVMARRANVQHRKSHEGDRTIPLLVADYGYVRNYEDEILATVLVVRLYPYNLSLLL